MKIIVPTLKTLISGGIIISYKYSGDATILFHPRKRFTFQRDSRWRAKLEGTTETAEATETTKEKIKAVISAYQNILKKDNNKRRIIEAYGKSQAYEKAITLLKLQYDDINEKLETFNDNSALDVFFETYTLLSETFKSTNSNNNAAEISGYNWISNSITAIKKENWQYTLPKDRQDFLLEHIFNKRDDSVFENHNHCIKLLTNFNRMGYMMIFHILKSIEATNIDALNADQITDYLKTPAKKKEDQVISEAGILKYKSFFETLNDKYKKYESSKSNKSIWKNKLLEMCKEEIKKICEKELKEVNKDNLDKNAIIKCAIPYVYAINHNIFWDLFTGKELEDSILDDEK